ncbi:MAG: hypothetical protein IT372_16445 [Polyangiaceae bacterium]|nr:hypothetical protein [Polyangiaceae bacterium]
MHAFTPDGKHLLLTDAFGLTRVTLPSKIKTDRDAGGSWLCTGGPHVLAFVGRDARARVFDAITLDRKDGSFARSTIGALHPDGAHAVTIEQTDEPLAARPLAGYSTHYIALPDASDAGAVDLGPARHAPAPLVPRIAMGPDGSIAWLDARRGKLFVGELHSARGPLTGVRAYSIAAPRGFVELRTRLDGTFVCAWHPGERRAYLARLTPDGAVRTRAVPALGQVAFTGDHVAYQPDERTVVREPFEGGAAQTFALPEGAGAGEVMADGAVVCFVPEDRARVLNLTAKKEAARKPPDAARETHAFISRLLARCAPAMAESGQTISLTDIVVPRNQGRCRPALELDAGDGGPLPFLVIGNVIWTLWNTEGGRYMVGSYDNLDALRPAGVPEMTRALATLEAHGLSLMRGLDYMTCALGRRYDPNAGGGPELPWRPLMERDAAHLLIWAALEQIRAGRDVPVAAIAPELLARPLTPEAVMEIVEPGAGCDDWRGYCHGQTALAYLLLFYFREASLPIFIDWLLARPSDLAQRNAHILGVPAARLARMSPDAHAALLAACDREIAGGDADRARQGASVKSSIEFNMQR